MKIFIERPIATAMIFLALTVLGVYSFLNIPIEMPVTQEQFPELAIMTDWWGMPPDVIQTQLTSPIEEKVTSIKGVRKIESSSSIGNSQIKMEFDPKTNMEFAQLAMREKLSELKDDLPFGVKPVIQPWLPEDFSERPFLKYTISGDYSLQKLREVVKDKLEIGLGAVRGVAGVDIFGGSEPQIRIVLDDSKVKSLKVQPFVIYQAIIERARIYPAGTARKGPQEFLFKVANPIQSLRELGDIVVARSGDNVIKLRDIAALIPSYEDIRHIHRINGQPTISMTIHKEKGLSTLKVSRDVKKRLEAIKEELPPDLIFRTVDDESQEIRKHLRELYILVAIIICVIFGLIFLVLRSIKPSLLVLSSIGFSVLLTFNLVYLTKITLNMLTLGGLALGFGLFVDNSIVVFENVLRIRESGVSAVQAAVKGSREVFLPVFASTLTTMSVFFSIAYFQGRLKLVYLPMAIVIGSALAASLLVSFSVIPALAPRMLKGPRVKRKERYRDLYAKVLRFLMKHPIEILLIIAALFYASYSWFRSEVTLGEFFSWYSEERLIVSVGLPAGTDIEQTDAVMRQFEEKVLEKKYEKEMDTHVLSEQGFIEITFPPDVEMSYRPYLLKEEMIQLAANFAGINIGIYGFDPQGYHSGFGSGPFYDSQIKFYGYNLKKLRDITAGIEKTLKGNPRIKEVKIVSSRRWAWWMTDSFEYILKLDKEALRKYDIDPNYLFYQIYTQISGRGIGRLKVKIAGKELEFSIKSPKAEELDLEELRDVMIQTYKGEYLRLGEISKLLEKPIAGSIDREDQQFQQTVGWEFRGPGKAAQRYREGVFARLRLPPGFSASIEDTWFLTVEEKGQIKFAIIFSLVVIFMILAALYESIIQPFFILLAVPLALIGVFVAFVIADFSFDSSAYIGVILLGGIVVNNSILLVDHMNLKQKQGIPLYEAVIQGARERVRPILMTTGTTVLGMLPLVLIQLEAGKKQIWASLALSAVGGLISSTFFILIAIPIFYYYGDGARRWFIRRTVELKTAWKNF
ncbi:MAG: efflux RND transporter permease subunit [Candidatus Aminicenantes bacterium]|nr:efflux RND transporter permease subunit [Candidatus Aminicenantes bacterium]